MYVNYFIHEQQVMRFNVDSELDFLAEAYRAKEIFVLYSVLFKMSKPRIEPRAHVDIRFLIFHIS